MRFMLLQNYGEVESDCPPMTEWSPGPIKAHIDFQQVMNAALRTAHRSASPSRFVRC